MLSFGVVCNAIGHSIQSRLLYLPEKYQGRATAWTRVIGKLQWLLKMETAFLYSLYVAFLGAHRLLESLLVKLVKLIYKTMCLRRAPLLDFSAHFFLLLLLWGRRSYRRSLFSSFCLGMFLGYLLGILVFIKRRCFVLMHNSSYKLYYKYVWKKSWQETCNVDLSDFSNYYFSKIFACF